MSRGVYEVEIEARVKFNISLCADNSIDAQNRVWESWDNLGDSFVEHYSDVAEIVGEPVIENVEVLD